MAAYATTKMCETETEFYKKIRAKSRAIAVFTAQSNSEDMLRYLVEELPGKFKGAKFVYADAELLEPAAHRMGLAGELPAVILTKGGNPVDWIYLSPEKKTELEKKIEHHIKS